MDRNEDFSENVNYTSKGLPVLTSDEHLSELATYRELMHWHPDYEFLLVKDGVLDFEVNGEILHIQPTQGLFVNSERMHFGYSEEKQEVLFELVIISPEMIRNAFNSDALDQLSSPANADYLIFHSNYDNESGNTDPVALKINMCPEERMMCYDRNILKEIVLYFCEFGLRHPEYNWIQDEL